MGWDLEACTVLQLLSGVSDPRFDVFFVSSQLDGKQVVATKAAIQLLGHLLKVVYFARWVAAGVDRGPLAITLAMLLPRLVPSCPAPSWTLSAMLNSGAGPAS